MMVRLSPPEKGDYRYARPQQDFDYLGNIALTMPRLRFYSALFVEISG
ncbi:hypothetical protein CBM2586_B130487 [Cupriavidus phytorum]|uniref:Uncharacterized protein n=1 Tax=Cupriavidus taiwanensis TaxID=164546 RepID=A0A375CJD4_9BURK|nr:hypothetical protein CBM2586_B130487 [Cupriavidus taiwanensis]